MKRKDATKGKIGGRQNGVGQVEGSVESVASLAIMLGHAQMLKTSMRNPILIVFNVCSLFLAVL